VYVPANSSVYGAARRLFPKKWLNAPEFYWSAEKASVAARGIDVARPERRHLPRTWAWPRTADLNVAAAMLPEALVSRDNLRDFGLALLTTETCFKSAGGTPICGIGDHRRIPFSFSLARK
jgi:hypothetical protein